MKSTYRISIQVLIAIFILTALSFNQSCQKREWENPYDERISPSSWAPYDLQIEDVSITEKKLTWKCDAENIDGFRLDRKAGNNEWQKNYKEVGKGTYEVTDNDVIPDPELDYSYRLYAYAGNLSSASVEISKSFEIDPVSDLQIQMISVQEIKLSWTDQSEGEQGFKIDRKVGSGSWETEYGEVIANVGSFMDNDDFSGGEIIYYKIYAFYELYNSTPTESSINTACPSPFTDPRNGKSYETIQIGTQCWMAENLNYQTGNSWCYDNSSSNCDTYGRLYDWATLMNGASSSNAVPSGIQGICPDGWHVPSDAEWTILVDYLGGDDIAGGAMKEAGYAHWNEPNTGATNSSGFSALPGGYRGSIGDFTNMGYGADFWSSTEGAASNAWYRTLNYGYADVLRYSYPNKENGRSVRCLRD